MKYLSGLFALTLFCLNSAFAQVSVTDPWARATVTAQKSSGAFMTLTSKSDTRLVAVSTPVAHAEIHEMSMQGDVMKMQKIDGIDLSAGKPLELGPGGYHIMLFRLKQQLKEGESVPLKLTFEGKDKKRETVEVKAMVRPLNASGGTKHDGGMKHDGMMKDHQH